MRTRLAKVFTSDKARIASLVLMVALLAAGGAKLNRMLAEHLLSVDAANESSAWAKNLTESADDLPAILAGASPSAKTVELLKQATAMGGIYRYKLWDKQGNFVAYSNVMKYPANGPEIVVGHHDDLAAEAILAGSEVTEARHGTPPANPVHFTKSYMPIRQNGKVIGVFEIFMDKTSDYELYQRFLLLSESIFTVLLLLAAAVPGFMFYRKMLAHRSAQAEALFLSEHDSLTGVPSRTRLAETAKSLLALAVRNKSFTAALLINIDRFKDINESFGHSVGDALLQTFTKRLTASIRTEDMVARLGGDEFVVLQVGMEQPSGATYLGDRLMKMLDEPYEIDDLNVRCSVSMGVAVAPTDAKDWDSLLSCAGAALTKAKDEGGHTTCFFEVGMDAIIRERRMLKLELMRAMDTNVLHLAYQPIFNLQKSSLLGFEALLRWPEGWEPQSPAAFIPIAEESGLIVPIGAWALETACKTAAAWTKPLMISVNLSPVQFHQGDIVATVERALSVSGLDPRRLELEVTESLWLEDTDTVLDQLARLRAMGISIALDDFGTGYSSLTHLWKFPFDIVKIDRSFVAGMNLNPKAAAIIHTVLALGRALHLVITAEGVETPAQAQTLKDAGCDNAQGYWFGRPLTASSANELANLPPLGHARTFNLY